MAKKTVTHWVDDLDGGPAEETVQFGSDGTTYDIDLSAAHAAELRERLSPFVANARRSGTASRAGGRAARGPVRSAGSRAEAHAIRTWARENGYAVSERGRISQNVLIAYRGGVPAPVVAEPGSAAGSGSAASGDPGTAPTDAGSTRDAGDVADADVLAWHEAKGYKIPAGRQVNGLMRHRYRTAHATGA